MTPRNIGGRVPMPTLWASEPACSRLLRTALSSTTMSTTDESSLATRILVTSACGANGNGYGAILGFNAAGALTGLFCQDRRITDPRGLSLHPSGEVVYVNSGDDRVLALDG